MLKKDTIDYGMLVSSFVYLIVFSCVMDFMSFPQEMIDGDVEVVLKNWDKVKVVCQY